MAAVKPRPHSVYFYVSHGHFSITLGTTTATQIGAGSPNATSVVSDVLIVCPTGATSSIAELHLGFPGAKLKLTKGRYRFARSYVWKHAEHNIISGAGAGTTTYLPSVNVKVTGTVASATLITGTVTVNATGCNMPSSSYSATGAKGLG